MIFQTQNQLNNSLIFIFFGFIVGLFSIVYYLIIFKKTSKKLTKSIINCIFYLIFSIFFVFLIIFFNFGKFSLVLFLLYLTSFLYTKHTFSNSVVLLKKLCYNKVKGRANAKSGKD